VPVEELNRKTNGEAEMANVTRQGPESGELEEQLKTLRKDVANLADVIKGMAASKTADASRAAHEQAENLIRRTTEAAEGATQRARGAVVSIEDHIAEKPVQSALIALLIGIVIGSLGRR
jgi:ElaB/YqjD/DUF883 family membrane-anchored ribosome-binding protein